MAAFVYLLRCSDGTLYCGWSSDVPRRLTAHNSGKASKYTSRRLPVEVAAAWRTPDRTTARRLEWAIKQLGRHQKDALVAGEAPLEGAERISV